jgi:hypothetical protein
VLGSATDRARKAALGPPLNGPELTGLTGPVEALQRTAELLADARIASQVRSVPLAFHSRMMEGPGRALIHLALQSPALSVGAPVG